MEECYAYSTITKVISINMLYFDFGKQIIYTKVLLNFIGLHQHDQLELTEKQKELFKMVWLKNNVIYRDVGYAMRTLRITDIVNIEGM